MNQAAVYFWKEYCYDSDHFLRSQEGREQSTLVQVLRKNKICVQTLPRLKDEALTQVDAFLHLLSF